MSIKQKAISIAMIGTVAASSLATTPALAVASELSPQETEIFMIAEDEQPGTTVLRERGRCTDSYSKEWCDSHGFQNNRPVPHKVNLTKRESDCYWGMLKAGSKTFINAVTQGPAGVLKAAPSVAYALWKCIG